MDRRKSELKAQLIKLQEESQSTVELLNKLSEMCSSQVDSLNSMDTNEFRLNSEYFLDVTHFQFQTYQKLLRLNMDLEEHIAINESVTSDEQMVEKPTISSVKRELAQVKALNHSIVQLNTNDEHILEQPTKITSIKRESSQVKVLNRSIMQVNPDDEHILEQPTTISSMKRESSQIKVLNHNMQLNPNIKQQEDNQLEPINLCSKENATQAADLNIVSKFKKLPEPKLIDLSSKDETIKVTDLNIAAKLKKLSEATIKKRVVEPMPGVSLQPSGKKMSTLVKEQLIKGNEKARKAINNDFSSEDDFPVLDMPMPVIKERADPKVNQLCTIGHIVSPSEFYIQVADEHSSNLDLLSTQLESLSYHNYANCSKMEAMKILGNFGCIKLDSLWYRVEVLDWMLNATSLRQDQISLQLIDYGNILNASYKDLCPILEELFVIPRMAQLCHLDSLYPPGSVYNRILTKWSEESKDGFLNICGDLNSNIFEISHVSKDANRKSFAIDLFNTEEPISSISIGQILLDTKLAVEIFDQPVVANPTIMNQILKSHGLQNIKQNMTRDEILEMYFVENNMKEARTINEAVMDYDPRDEANTCKNMRSDGTCYKGNKCTLRHVPLTDGFTRDKHPVYNRAFVELQLPSTGEEVLLTISHVCSLQRFYAQIRNTTNRNLDKPTINTLISDMNNPETIKLYNPLRYPPGLSQLVIVKHWNSHWYRGQVRNINIPEIGDDVMVEVWVVDFGDILVVPISDLRTIEPEFLRIPFQAVECRLFNVRHKNGSSEDEEKRYFESRYLGQTFKAYIKAVPGYLEVLLYTKENEDLGEKLIQNGYGEENTEHNFPKENEIYLID